MIKVEKFIYRPFAVRSHMKNMGYNQDVNNTRDEKGKSKFARKPNFRWLTKRLRFHGMLDICKIQKISMEKMLDCTFSTNAYNIFSVT